VLIIKALVRMVNSTYNRVNRSLIILEEEEITSARKNNRNMLAVLEDRNVAGSRFELLISGFLKATELL
jgi:hypothetical protein